MTYGLIGEHLAHSWSPLVHKLVSGMDYSLAEVPREDLGHWLRHAPFRGINVTIPYKQEVIPWLDSLSGTARKTGAVNTVTKTGDGLLTGYNTDVYGASEMMLRSGVRIRGSKLAVLGRGGAARAVAEAALGLGAASVRFAVRNPDSPDQLPISNPEAFRDCGVLVNATPVGMYPDLGSSPLDISSLPDLQAVFDCIYNPLRSSLVLDARSRGIAAFGGLRMLVSQAVKAEELWLGKSFDESVAEITHAAVASRLANIVLTGMPYSGKTTVGRELAALTGRQLIDTDREIVAAAGKGIPEIFASEGEEGFRRREAEVVRALAPRTGLVIAAGGGTVLSETNLKLLKHNGLLCLIERPAELMQPSPDRPLAPDRQALSRLAAERGPAYSRAADFSICNDGSPKQAAESMWDLFNKLIQRELL